MMLCFFFFLKQQEEEIDWTLQVYFDISTAAVDYLKIFKDVETTSNISAFLPLSNNPAKYLLQKKTPNPNLA